METPATQPKTENERAAEDNRAVAPMEKLLLELERIREDMCVRQEKPEQILAKKILAAQKKRRVEKEALTAFLKEGRILAANMFDDKRKPTHLPFGEQETVIDEPEQYVYAMRCLFARLGDDFKRKMTNIYNPERDFITEYFAREIMCGTGASGFFVPLGRYENANRTRKRNYEEMRALKREQEEEYAKIRRQTAFVARGYQHHVEGFAERAVISAAKNATTDRCDEVINIIIELLAINGLETFCKFENMEQIINDLVGLIETFAKSAGETEQNPEKLGAMEKTLSEIRERVKSAL